MKTDIKIRRIDHIVLTVKDVDVTSRFYQSVLGMTKAVFGEGRVALLFGKQKINLHRAGSEFEPKALRATEGSSDLCFITDTPLAEVMNHLEKLMIDIIEGPVARTGATGQIISVYLRDPDGNLIEVSNYME